MAETSTNLGRVSLVPRGEYDPSAQYQRLDVVSFEGSSYLALHSVRGVAPTDSQDYMLLALRGEDGRNGKDGLPGEDGRDGKDGLPGKDGETGNGIAGIERTSGTGAPGTVDVYTITMTDGSTATFQVRNGADGQGTGDMSREVYDPDGRHQDIFLYANEAAADASKAAEAKAAAAEALASDAQGAAKNALAAAAEALAEAQEAEREAAAKQDTLTGRRGQVVGFDASGAAAAVEGWSNWNFVDNGGFDLWRNGTVFDAYGLMYTADRWNNSWQKCRYERVDNPFPDCSCRYAMKVTVGEEEEEEEESLWASVRQPVAPELAAALDGRTVTISAWVMGQSQAPFALAAGNVTTGYTIPLSTQPQRIVFTGIFDVDADSDVGAQGLAILSALNGSNGAQAGDWYIITGIKLELGSSATPYVPRGLPLEYALCSQYSSITGEWDGFRHSNPNLLDNGGFDIWQKGTEFDAGSRIYTADRWHNDNQVCRYERIDNPFTNCPCQYAMKVTAMNDAQWLSVAQPIDPELAAALDGQTVTISTWVMGRSAAPGIMWLGSIRKDGIPMDGQPHHVSATGVFHADAAAMAAIAIDASSGTSTGDWQIVTGVKIELGDVATPFSPPNKALELAKCQRYMLVLPNDGDSYRTVGTGYSYSTTQVKIGIPLPVTMRTWPAITLTGMWTLVGNGKSYNFDGSTKSIGSPTRSQNLVTVAIGGFSGLTNNQTYSLENADPAATLILDANL